MRKSIKACISAVVLSVLSMGSAHALDQAALTKAFRFTVARGNFEVNQHMTQQEMKANYVESGTPGTDLYNGVDTRVSAVLTQPSTKDHGELCEAAFSLAVIAAGTNDFDGVVHSIGFDQDANWTKPLAFVRKHPNWVHGVWESVGVSNDGFYSEDHSVLVRSCMDLR